MSYSFPLLHAAVFDRRSREARLTGTHDLKQILLFELLKYGWKSTKQSRWQPESLTALDLDKLIADEERE